MESSRRDDVAAVFAGEDGARRELTFAGLSAEVMVVQKKSAVRGGDLLERLAVVLNEGGAQGFVASDDAVKGPAQGAPVELTAQPDTASDVVGFADPLELGQEP